MLLLAPLIGLMPKATLAAMVIVYSIGLIKPVGVPGNPGCAARNSSGRWSRWSAWPGRHARGDRRRHHRVDGRARSSGRRIRRFMFSAESRGRMCSVRNRPSTRTTKPSRPADAESAGADFLRECEARRPEDEAADRVDGAENRGARSRRSIRFRIHRIEDADGSGAEVSRGARRRALARRAEPRRSRDGAALAAGSDARKRQDVLQHGPAVARYLAEQARE